MIVVVVTISIVEVRGRGWFLVEEGSNLEAGLGWVMLDRRGNLYA